MFILFCLLYFLSIRCFHTVIYMNKCLFALCENWTFICGDRHFCGLLEQNFAAVLVNIRTEFFNTIIFLVSRTRGLSWRLSRQSLVARSRPSIPAPDHVMLCRRWWVVLHMTVEVPRLKRPHSSSDWGMYKCTRRFYLAVFILALWKFKHVEKDGNQLFLMFVASTAMEHKFMYMYYSISATVMYVILSCCMLVTFYFTEFQNHLTPEKLQLALEAAEKIINYID